MGKARPVAAQCQRFQPPHVSGDGIERIEIVARFVAVGEKRFAGILCAHKACLEGIAVAESIAQVMAIGIAQVSVVVALPLIERNLGRRRDRMFTVFQYVFPFRESLFLLLSDKDETQQQLPFLIAEAAYHGQFACRLQRSVLIYKGHDVLHFLRR